jgi:hypothetical protein
MAAVLTASALTFSADQVRTLNELVIQATLKAPELSALHTFVTGIKYDREIGIIPGTMGLLIKAAQGCGTKTATNSAVTIAKKTWAPKRGELVIKQCYTDLEASFLRFALQTGNNVSDLTSSPDAQTAYFAFLLDYLSRDVPKNLLMKAWFDNTDAANVNDSPAGAITTGVDTDYFNLIDGFFVQLATIYGSDATRLSNIAANEQATKALQFSVLTPTLAYDALNALVDDAPAVLLAQPDKEILCTRSLVQKAKRYLQGQGMPFDVKLISEGFELIKWDGVDLVSMPLWDEWILAYENNGTKLNDPHRAVLISKANLNIGMEGNSLFDSFEVIYDPIQEYNWIKAKDSFDAKILDDTLVQVAR